MTGTGMNARKIRQRQSAGGVAGGHHHFDFFPTEKPGDFQRKPFHRFR
jgi:hypothetical protein